MQFFAAVAESSDALITAIAVGIPAISTIIVTNIQHGKKLDKVSEQVATSNGRTTGQYVEQLAHQFTILALGQESIQKQLAEHTVQDAANFAALDAQIGQGAKDSGTLALLQARVANLEEQAS